jgi:hypothetical protein
MNFILATLVTIGFSFGAADKPKDDGCPFPLFVKDGIVILNPERLDALDNMAYVTAAFTCSRNPKDKCVKSIIMKTNKDKSRDYKFNCGNGGKEI